MKNKKLNSHPYEYAHTYYIYKNQCTVLESNFGIQDAVKPWCELMQTDILICNCTLQFII